MDKNVPAFLRDLTHEPRYADELAIYRGLALALTCVELRPPGCPADQR